MGSPDPGAIDGERTWIFMAIRPDNATKECERACFMSLHAPYPVVSMDGRMIWLGAGLISAAPIFFFPENANSTACDGGYAQLLYVKGFPYDDGNREMV
ncbi:MAG: hypothetical protein RBS99_06155 [Rhodospirillales bacterium]|jgi:hypothetical protein|nr:hypothetical protein [Rhodospirillales bacterium]